MALVVESRVIKFTASGPIDLDILGPEFVFETVNCKRVQYNDYILCLFKRGAGSLFDSGTMVSQEERLDTIRALLSAQNLELTSFDVKQQFEFDAGIQIPKQPFIETNKFRRLNHVSAIGTIKRPVTTHTFVSIQENSIMMHFTNYESAIEAYYENVRGVNSAVDAKWCNAVMAEIMGPKCVCLREKLDDLVLHRVFSFMV